LFSSNGLDVDIHLDGDEGVCTEFIFNNKNIDFFVTLTLWENESNNGILVKTSESYSDIIYETNEINENSLINGLLIVISVLQKLIREAF